MFFRKAILVIHGFAGGTYDLEFLSNYLEVDRYFDVFTITLPGHDKLTLYSSNKKDWVDCVEKQTEWLISKGYNTIYLVGHSMGCVLASHLATKYKQIKKVVLLAPAFNYFSFVGNSFSFIKAVSKTKDITTALKGYGGDDIFSRIVKAPYSAIKNFTELVRDHYDDPKDISVPILILHGDKDKIAPLNSAEYVYDSVKSKVDVLMIVKGASHDIKSSDKKDIICNSVYGFLKNNRLFNYKGKIEI